MSDFRTLRPVALTKLGETMGLQLARYVQANCATCLTCANFIEPFERCKLNNQRPPARVIAFGCEQYAYNGKEI